MDAKQLHRCLEYVVNGSCEVYVVSREIVSRIVYMGRTLVICANTSPSDEDDGHWVVFITYYSSDGIVSDYYDSLAKPAIDYLIDNPYPIVNYNRRKHQSDGSPNCSLYVIYFVYHWVHKPPFRRALSYFSAGSARNESAVRRFFEYIKADVAKMPATHVECQRFGCYPKSNDSLKRKYEQ